MRRTVIIVPGLLSEPESESYLRQKLPAFSLMAELATLSKVAVTPPTTTPEAMLLGLRASAIHLAQGPLMVSALGFDPPERSTHFHLSLMSFDDGVASSPGMLPTPEEVDVILKEAQRLNTKALTVLKGEELNHAAVWEGLGDMYTTSADEVQGQFINGLFPQGDADILLRKLIDDSINLFSSLEFNIRRIDQGLPAFNLLWPWGQGTRSSVPNLALKRGEPAFVESGSMRLAGLTRLAGYRHVDRSLVGKGLRTKLRDIAGRALTRQLTITYLDVPINLRMKNMREELDWFVKQLGTELLQPLLDDHLKSPSRVTLIAPGGFDSVSSSEMPWSPVGLSMSVETGVPSHNVYPFDERALEERSVSERDLWSLIESAILMR